MYEEITGVNEAAVEETPIQAAAEQDDDVVTVADLMGDEPEDQAEAQEEQGEQQQEEDAPEAQNGAADQPEPEPRHNNARERENNAFAKRLAAEKRKMETDPVYKLGRELAADGSGNKRLNIQPHSGRKALCDLCGAVDDVTQQLRAVAFAVHRDFIHLAERFSDILGDFRQSVLDTPHG